jgi:predicted nucleic acid-binding protein
VGHLFVLHDRSYRLCRQHLSRVPSLIEDARRRLVNPFITLTLYDPDLIVAVLKRERRESQRGAR